MTNAHLQHRDVQSDCCRSERRERLLEQCDSTSSDFRRGLSTDPESRSHDRRSRQARVDPRAYTSAKRFSCGAQATCQLGGECDELRRAIAQSTGIFSGSARPCSRRPGGSSRRIGQRARPLAASGRSVPGSPRWHACAARRCPWRYATPTPPCHRTRAHRRFPRMAREHAALYTSSALWVAPAIRVSPCRLTSCSTRERRIILRRRLQPARTASCVHRQLSRAITSALTC